MTTATAPRRRRASSFGSVRKLPSGRWQASYWHDGERHKAPSTFATKGDGTAWLANVRSDITRGAWVDPASSSVLFRDYSRAWLDQRHDLRPSTRDDYGRLLRVHLVPEFGELALSAISPAKVRGWHARLAKDHPARASKGYRLLRTILGTAVADRQIITNPCVVRGAGQERAAERSIPSIAEVDALAEAMPARLALLVYLAAWCGLRRGELLGLTRSDVDLLHGELTVRRSLVELGDGTVVVGEPKTEAGKRTISIPPHLAAMVTDHLSAFAGPHPDSPLFSGATGSWLRPQGLQRAWEAARVQVGVRYRLHDLRHLGATLTAATGASTKEIMRRLGHASPRAALIYQHATDDRDAAIGAALSELARPAPIKGAAVRDRARRDW